MATTDLELRASAGEARAQIDLAARLDEANHHDEAVNWLARAARGGNAEALRLLGLRLLTGRDAPPLPAQGAGMLAESARQGDAQAASVTSVLFGGGFYAPQDWRLALDYLQHAAELGSSSAQDQLRVLSGDGIPCQAGAPDPWKRLRQFIEVSAWTSAPTPAVLSSAPRVLAVKGLVPPEACDWIVEQSRGRLVRAEVHDARTGLTVMGQTRTNQVANFELVDTSLLNLFIQAKIAAATGVPTGMMEAFAVLHYGVGEEASEHFDYLDPSVTAYAAEIAQLGQRVATCLLYLNEDYKGGETEFPLLGIRHRGGKGDALIFFSADASGVPDPRTVHAGRPPTAGEKWVLSQFIRNRQIAPGAG